MLFLILKTLVKIILIKKTPINNETMISKINNIFEEINLDIK